jgi:hypothetical protein
VALTNTVLVSQTVGVTVTAGSTARLEATLWGSGDWGNGQDWGGAGSVITGTINRWGNPRFVDPAAGDYHIAAGSAALDTGVDAGIGVDMDGQVRPVGTGVDLGADEFSAALELSLAAVPAPFVPAGSRLTYTLAVTNLGLLPLTATVASVLPVPVSPTGVLTWSFVLPAGDAWTELFAVEVDTGYTGPLTNVARVDASFGLTDVVTGVVWAEVPIAGLQAWNDGPTPLGGPTTLTASVFAGSNVSYTWALGDGEIASGALVTHTYLASGTYTAVVTASNGFGPVEATTVVAVLESAYRIYLPLVARD